MEKKQAIASENSGTNRGGDYYEMSGTSQAAAMMSGIVALMIQQDPRAPPKHLRERRAPGPDALRPHFAGLGQDTDFAVLLVHVDANMIHG
jgi:hypothetical protein